MIKNLFLKIIGSAAAGQALSQMVQNATAAPQAQRAVEVAENVSRRTQIIMYLLGGILIMQIILTVLFIVWIFT